MSNLSKKELIEIIKATKGYYKEKIDNILKGKNISLTEEKHLKDIQLDIIEDFNIICDEISLLKD